MKKRLSWLHCIVIVFWGLYLGANSVFALDISVFQENFETGGTGWYSDNGVWEVGVPSSGPVIAHGGNYCTGTVLSGSYPNNIASRIIYPLPFLPGLQLPEISGEEELHFQFFQWFSYASGDHGQVQISLYDEVDGWSDWENISNQVGFHYSELWTLKSIDISAYAGKKVRFSFFHTADSNGYTHYGWYIDDIEIVKILPEFTGHFESGWSGWYADNGVWETGIPMQGPDSAHQGSQCAGTVLNGSYYDYTDSRLISPTVALEEISGEEELHFQFFQWFSYASGDHGQVQISLYDEVDGWSDWENISNQVGFHYSELWTLKSIDISAYAGKKVRFSFFHTADSNGHTHYGWYIDDIEIVKILPEFTGHFESGWSGWYADNGVWETGIPMQGPDSAHQGSQCAGTVLNGNYYDYTDSRLISPTVRIPQGCGGFSPVMSFWHWWSYSSGDSGMVQVSTLNEETGEWSAWENAQTIPSTISGSLSAWHQGYAFLSDYVDKWIRIAFYHTADSNGHVGPGWYIDDIEFPMISPTIDKIFHTVYIPPPCTSNIRIETSNPCGGGLSYYWNASDGGNVVGSGPEVEFIPPDQRIEPYYVQVSVTSGLTRISSSLKTIKIYTQVLYDYEPDEDIDGRDVSVAAGLESTDLRRLAEEFGMVACQ